MLESTSLDNVGFSAYTLVYNSTIGRHVLSSSPTKTNILGHLQEFAITPEGEADGIHERDNSIRYRFIVRRSKDLESILVEGAVLRVTKRRHPDTYGWYGVTSNEQYIIKDVSEIHSVGRFMNIGLVRKDAA